MDYHKQKSTPVTILTGRRQSLNFGAVSNLLHMTWDASPHCFALLRTQQQIYSAEQASKSRQGGALGSPNNVVFPPSGPQFKRPGF